MKRLLLLLALLLVAPSAQPQGMFNSFQAASTGGGGGGGLPPGVTLIQPDGGTTFHATNGFTTATKPFTTCFTTPYPSCTGITYTQGWDDPQFFPIGWFLEFLANGQSDIDLWLNAYTNSSFAGIAGPSTGQLDLLLHNGMSNVASYEQSGQSIALDRKYGDETKGVFTWDEPPSYEIGWVQAIQGYPSATFTAYAGGGFSAAQSNCIIAVSSMSYGFIGQVTDNVFGASTANLHALTGMTLTGSGFTTEPISWLGPNSTGFASTIAAAYQVSTVSTAGTYASPISLSFSPSGATATGQTLCNILVLQSVTGTIANGDTVSGAGVPGGTTVTLTGYGAGAAGNYASCDFTITAGTHPNVTCTSQTTSGSAASSGFQFVVGTLTSPNTTPVLSTMGFADGRLLYVPYFSGAGIPANTWSAEFDIFGGSGQSNPINNIPWTYDFNFGSPTISFPPETVTQQTQPGFNTAEFVTDSMDTRFSWSNVTNAFIAFQSLHSSMCPGLFYGASGCVATDPTSGNKDLTASFILNNTVVSPGGKTRRIDVFSFDFYWFVIGRCQQIYGSNCSTTMANLYSCCQTDIGYTQAQAAKGTHYGDQADMIRELYPGGALGGNTRPQIIPLETSQCICAVPYDIQPVEIQWGFWGAVVHGIRGIGYFGQNGGMSTSGCTGGGFGDTIYCTYTNTPQEVTITSASISGNVLTVPNPAIGAQNPSGNGQFSRGQLGPGMRLTSGGTGPSQILQQLTFGQGADANFTATFSGTNSSVMTVSGTSCPANCITIPSMFTGIAGGPGFTSATCSTNPFIRSQLSGTTTGGDGTYSVDPATNSNCLRGAGPYPVISSPVASFTITAFSPPFNATTGIGQNSMTVTGTQGTIIIPSSLIGANMQNHGQLYGQGNVIIRAQVSGTPGGDGVYTVDNNNAPLGQAQAMGAPGGPGTYLINGGSGSGTLKYKQSGWDCVGCTSGPTIATDTSNVGGVTAVDKLILNMAPIINSPNAAGFLVSQSPDRYMFERGGTQNCNTGSITHNIKSTVCGLANGIDSVVKWYTGPTYTAITGDVITTNTFYLIATTAFPETSAAIGASFTICAACAFTTADVIGEGRTIPLSGKSFSDTFPNAWNTKIYKIH